jgi:predicted lipoprotein with Yx(FWY)xxD motif
MVLCTGSCAQIWKPLLVRGTPKAKGVHGKLAIQRRAGGARQVTFNGKPLYTFALEKAGMVTGNGLKDAFGSRHFTWHVVRPAGAASPAPTTSTPQPYPGY